MNETIASYERTLGEHVALYQRIARLRERLVPPAAPNEDAALRRWAWEVADQLFELREALVDHFADEEASGVLGDLAEEFPEHTRRLEALSAEHAALLAEERDIVSDFTRFSGADGVGGLVRRTQELMDRLLRHEQEEMNLMQRSYTEDLGTP